MSELDAPPPEQALLLTRRSTSRADAAFAGVVVGLLLLTGTLYWLFPGIMAVFLLSAILAYALMPLVDWLERKGLPRTLGVTVVGLGVAGVLAGLGVLLAPMLVAEVERMPEAVQKTADQVVQLWARYRGRLPAPLVRTAEGWVGSLQNGGSGLLSEDRLTAYATQAATGITAVASGLVLVPVFVFLMLRGYHRFMEGMEKLVPPRWRTRFSERTREVDTVLAGFIRGQLLVALLLAVQYCIAFSIIGVPLAILVGILAGFGELIPFIGNAVALTLGVLLAVAGGEPMDAVWVVGSYALIQTLQATVISPMVMGRSVKLSPVTIIVALAIGGEMLGIIGMLIAVPASALLKVAGRAAVSAYRLSGFYRHGEAT